MKAKTGVSGSGAEPEPADQRSRATRNKQQQPQEFSPVRTSIRSRPGAEARTSSSGSLKRGSGHAGSSSSGGGGLTSSHSPGPTKSGTNGVSTGNSNASSGAGRTPQTRRREFTLSHAERSSSTPNGSPRSRENGGKAASAQPSRGKVNSSGNTRNKSDASSSSSTAAQSSANEDSSRKSSNSSQDSGIGRDTAKVTRTSAASSSRHHGAVHRTTSGRTRHNFNNNSSSSSHNSNSSSSQGSSHGGWNPPEVVVVDEEASARKKFEELLFDLKHVEMGIVKVPPDRLPSLIHHGQIEHYYDVDVMPVASGLFATVRKCTHKETGIEYAAKFSSRFRCGVDCTTEVLHEIALLSICAESTKIVHLKDVFQNKHEIILVLEYAPGGDFQSVLDDDMVPFEQDVQGFMTQLLEALSYIHQRNIAHLDIKPQNIVLMSEFPNCEIKLCDLEVSRVIQDNEEIREIIGTPDYVAPEILQMDPISLAADIWSLGVLAYVLLTGFSPFGGDTDQETLRNITTATLDFPAELFEGVSDDAKDFISQCLQRDPRLRPTVDECLSHPWLSHNSEPPSPSPLMLKIPAPDHFVSTPTPLSFHSLSGNSGSGPLGSSSRRSCQTCRDKITERKRYLSKSREAIFEKVANSNLKKSLSKSRERLCDMRLTLSKSRDYLNDTKMAASRSQEKFYGFKSLSKSQEVLSQALGGNMKRMVNGAVSDISPAHLPMNPRVYLDSADSCDFVILPGSSVLMSHADLMSLSRSAAGSPNPPFLTVGTDSLPMVEVSEPTDDLSSYNNVSSSQGQYNNVSSTSTTAKVGAKGCNSRKSVVETVPEELESEMAEEEEEAASIKEKQAPKENTNNVNVHADNKKKDEKASTSTVELRRKKKIDESTTTTSRTERRKSLHDAQNSRTCRAKEEKNSINYETKHSMARSSSVDRIMRKNQTNALGGKSSSRSNLVKNEKNGHELNSSTSSNVSIPAADMRTPKRSLTAEVAVQVNLTHSASSNDLPSTEKAINTVTRMPSVSSMPTFATTGTDLEQLDNEGNSRREAASRIPLLPGERRLSKGFSHEDTLGGNDDQKRYSWREELEKFRSAKKPLCVSDLIDAFSNNRNNSTGSIRYIGPIDGKTHKVSSADPVFSCIEPMKSKRRGSLQINLDSSKSLVQLTTESQQQRMFHDEALDDDVKVQRRKSTSAILPIRYTEVKMPNIDENATNVNRNNEPEPSKEHEERKKDLHGKLQTANRSDQTEKTDSEKEMAEEEDSSQSTWPSQGSEKSKVHEKSSSGLADNNGEKRDSSHQIDISVGEKAHVGEDEAKERKEAMDESVAASTSSYPAKGQVYLEKVSERKRTWDYFEINHPKAISDKKLEQLKAKYTRRKTAGNIVVPGSADREAGKDMPDDKKRRPPVTGRSPAPPLRTQSVPLIQAGKPVPATKSLDLAWDPLTGMAMGSDTASVDSGNETNTTRKSSLEMTEGEEEEEEMEEMLRRKQSESRESSLAEIRSHNEEVIPKEKVLQCFIDPFTGEFITSHVPKPKESSESKPSDGMPAQSQSIPAGELTSQLAKTAAAGQTRDSGMPLSVSTTTVGSADDGLGSSLPETPVNIHTEPPSYASKCGNNGPAGLDKQGPAAASTDGESGTDEQKTKAVVDDHEVDGHEITLDGDAVARALDCRATASSDEDEGGSVSSVQTEPMATSGSVAAVAAEEQRDASRSRSGSYSSRERVRANKVCTGSFSRGMERFRSESPAAVKSGTNGPHASTTNTCPGH